MKESSQCCCSQKIDSLTGRGYKDCNCIKPPVLVKQNCDCVASTVNGNGQQSNSTTTCTCKDCNNATSVTYTYQSTSAAEAEQCRCPNKFYRNLKQSTNNAQQPASITTKAFSCPCEVEFAGLCPAVNISAPLDEGTCDASNRPE